MLSHIVRQEKIRIDFIAVSISTRSTAKRICHLPACTRTFACQLSAGCQSRKKTFPHQTRRMSSNIALRDAEKFSFSTA